MSEAVVLNEAEKAALNKLIAELKSEKEQKITEAYNKVRNTKVIPQQNEIEQAKVKLINAYATEHSKSLETLKESYEASVKSENESYQQNIAKANSDAVANKATVEANVKEEISNETAKGYDAIIEANEKLLA